MVAESQANTPDTTGLPKSHTVTYSVSKRTNKGGQLVGRMLHDKQNKLKI